MMLYFKIQVRLFRVFSFYIQFGFSQLKLDRYQEHSFLKYFQFGKQIK